MRIFDVNGNELREEDIDLEAGYLTPDRKFVRHHDAVEGQERQAHYTVSAFYFEDGTKYEPQSEDDPHIHVDDAKAGLFSYNDVEGTGKKLRGIDLKEIEDSPAIPAQEAWDEYEDIQIYHIYTPEEIEQRERKAEEQRRIQQEQAQKEDAELFAVFKGKWTSDDGDYFDIYDAGSGHGVKYYQNESQRTEEYYDFKFSKHNQEDRYSMTYSENGFGVNINYEIEYSGEDTFIYDGKTFKR